MPSLSKKKKILMFVEAKNHMENFRWGDALEILEALLTSCPEEVEEITRLLVRSYRKAGVKQYQLANYIHAMQLYEKALRLEPMNSRVLNNMGNALVEVARREEAIRHYEKAIDAMPSNEKAWCNLGYCLFLMGQYDKAHTCFKKALKIDPEHITTHCNMAIYYFNKKEYRKAWKEYEWRLKKSRNLFPVDNKFFQLYWDGSSLGGSDTLMILGEHGFGNCIQFMRFIPLLRKKTKARLIFACEKTFHRLLKDFTYVDEIVDILGNSLPDYQAHLPLHSIPYIYNLSLEEIELSATIPYLTVDSKIIAEWRERIRSSSKIKIGVCWAGSSLNGNDRNRSISIKLLSPLFELPNVEIYNLQLDREPFFGDRRYENFFDLTSEISDFADTAALMKQLDLVICVDTSIAHLAGALGLPTWIMIEYCPCWRWHLEKDTSEWYPTVRLFRQEHSGDWSSVIGRVIEALQEKYKRKLK